MRENTVSNRKLTIIAKIRETRTRFLQPTRSECLGYLLVGQIVGPLWRPYERRRVGTYLEVHLGTIFIPIKNTRCAWDGGTTKFSRTIDRICWYCFFVLCFMSHRSHLLFLRGVGMYYSSRIRGQTVPLHIYRIYLSTLSHKDHHGEAVRQDQRHGYFKI